MASFSSGGPASRLRSSSKAQTDEVLEAKAPADEVLGAMAPADDVLEAKKEITSRLRAEGFTLADIKDLITEVEEGVGFEAFWRTFEVALSHYAPSRSVYSKAKLATHVFDELQEARKGTTTSTSTSTSTSTRIHNDLSLALRRLSLPTENKFSYQQWGNHAMRTSVARNQFPEHASSKRTDVVWGLWDSVVTAGKNSQLGKEIKAAVGPKGKRGPRSESRLKFLLQKQKLSEDVVSVFTPGFSGPCDTKVPDFFLVDKAHIDCPTNETIGALLYTQSTSDASKYTADAQVGEAVVAGNLFLTKCSEDRQYVYVGITDLKKIKWYKVERQIGATHQSSETASVNKSLAGFMYCPLCDLGIMNRGITVGARSFEMGKWLGGGLTSNVYLVTIDNEDYAVKVAKDGHELSADISNLLSLQGVKGILLIDKAKSNKRMVCMKPVCQKLDRRVLRTRNMRHCLADLVDTLQQAHERSIVNRDVREENIMISTEELVIVDWGFAATLGKVVHFAGTTHYASETVLAQLQNGASSIEFKASDDLVSLVRTLYGFFEMDEFGRSILHSISPESYADIRGFWNSEVPKNPLYSMAQKFASNGRYTELKKCLLTFIMAV